MLNLFRWPIAHQTALCQKTCFTQFCKTRTVDNTVQRYSRCSIDNFLLDLVDNFPPQSDNLIQNNIFGIRVIQITCLPNLLMDEWVLKHYYILNNTVYNQNYTTNICQNIIRRLSIHLRSKIQCIVQNLLYCRCLDRQFYYYDGSEYMNYCLLFNILCYDFKQWINYCTHYTVVYIL